MSLPKEVASTTCQPYETSKQVASSSIEPRANSMGCPICLGTSRNFMNCGYLLHAYTSPCHSTSSDCRQLPTVVNRNGRGRIPLLAGTAGGVYQSKTIGWRVAR